MNINYSNRIFGLDLMRALAITLVVTSHVIWITPITNPHINNVINLSGYLGVEIFFVLSGFLIGKILLRLYTSPDFNLKSVGYFLTRRWFRTLPNYYLILVLNIFLAMYLGTHLPQNVWHYMVFVQNLAWEMPSFFGESWSLSIEEFAYVLGPLFLYLALLLNTKMSKSKMFLWVTVLIIVGFTITKILYNASVETSTMNDWNTNLKAVVIYRIDAIYYGVLAAYIAEHYHEFWDKVKYYGVIIGCLIIVFLNLLLPKLGLFIETNPLFWNVFYLAINSIAIATTLPYLSNLKHAPNFILKPITFVSLISYAMYLVHFSIIIQLIRYIKTKGYIIEDMYYVWFYVLATLVLSYAFYRFYEQPMTSLRDRPQIKNYFK